MEDLALRLRVTLESTGPFVCSGNRVVFQELPRLIKGHSAVFAFSWGLGENIKVHKLVLLM